MFTLRCNGAGRRKGTDVDGYMGIEPSIIRRIFIAGLEWLRIENEPVFSPTEKDDDNAD